jgi:hypothetical protein
MNQLTNSDNSEFYPLSAEARSRCGPQPYPQAFTTVGTSPPFSDDPDTTYDIPVMLKVKARTLDDAVSRTLNLHLPLDAEGRIRIGRVLRKHIGRAFL